jgi:sec-independent protein translocase protein TatB
LILFDISWSEMLLIAAVSVVVIGPKDLPRALHAAGKFIRKIKVFSSDIQKSLDKIMQEGELEEITRSANKAGGPHVQRTVERQLAKEKAQIIDVEAQEVKEEADTAFSTPPLGDEDLRYDVDDAEGEEGEEGEEVEEDSAPEERAENSIRKKDSGNDAKS